MNTKEKLIEAYLNIIQEQGPGDISIKHLTDKVGITKSSFYSHFDSINTIEDEAIAFCMEELNKANFEINYKANNTEELFVDLINSFIDTFSQYPGSAFLILAESLKLTNGKFFQLSQRIDLMITSRLTVALDFCVQRSWSDTDDTDAFAQLLTPYIKTLLTNTSLSDDDLADSIRTITNVLTT